MKWDIHSCSMSRNQGFAIHLEGDFPSVLNHCNKRIRSLTLGRQMCVFVTSTKHSYISPRTSYLFRLSFVEADFSVVTLFMVISFITLFFLREKWRLGMLVHIQQYSIHLPQSSLCKLNLFSY